MAVYCRECYFLRYRPKRCMAVAPVVTTIPQWYAPCITHTYANPGLKNARNDCQDFRQIGQVRRVVRALLNVLIVRV